MGRTEYIQREANVYFQLGTEIISFSNELFVHNNVFPNHKTIFVPEAKDKLTAKRRLLFPNSLMARMSPLIILGF